MKPYFSAQDVEIYNCDARKLPPEDATVQMCVTSPPYFGLRDYGVDGQIGLEESPEKYVEQIVSVFREVRRVLKDDGVIWVNLGDSYASAWPAPSNRRNLIGQEMNGGKRSPMRQPRAMDQCKEKDLIGIPWMVAFALRADGWYLRCDIIWEKPDCMPDSVTDRPTRSHEYIFLLTKSQRYFYDADAIAEKAAEASLARWDQDIEGQQGSLRANGGAKTNGPMKAVRRGGGASFGKQNVSTDGTGAQSRQFDRPAYETRNKRTVWRIPTISYRGAHFATFPPALIEPCILAGSRPGDLVLDPFAGTSTTGEVCQKWGRRFVGTELNADYIDLSKARFQQQILFGAESK